MHGYRSEFLPTAPYQCQLVRGRPHLRPTIAPQQQGDEYQQHQDDIASHAAPPLIVCAVPSADREGVSRALTLYPRFPLPRTLCRAVRAYPELSALVGGHGPDLRRLFLRGHGGNSAALGVRKATPHEISRGYVWWGNAAPCMKYSHLYIFYTSLKQARIKNIRLHFGLPFKILLNYNILAVLSSFGTSIAIRKTTASKIPGTT